MNYVSFINGLLRSKVEETERLVCYGQNIAAGSCLSGLTRGLKAGPGGMVLNSPNAEATLVGLGFGLMIRGISGIFFMKQQDFLLLGMDHLVNTWNVVRMQNPRASFSVVTIVVDSGYEGPQSCLNNFADFCSMAHLPGYAITNRRDAELVVGRHLVAPGCRIIGVSQRLFGTELIDEDAAVACDAAGEVLKYRDGADATIVSFNFSFPQALEGWRTLAEAGRSASLFSVSAVVPTGWDAILEDAARSRRLVVVDDSKSENRASDRLMLAALQAVPGLQVTEARRRFTADALRPNPDRLEVNWAAVLDRLCTPAGHG